MNIPFVRYNNLGFITSSALIVIACISLLFKGLNLGQEFTGGIALQLKYDQKAELSKIRSSLSKIENVDFKVNNFGSDNEVKITFQSDTELNITVDTVENQLEEDNYLGKVVMTATVFPQIGEELRDKGGIAILVAMLVILVYIIFRFQIKFGYGAIAALFHDVLIILGIFSIFGLDFDLSVLAAILAVVGYSLNDSIVVSDRIRENFLDQNKKGSPEVLINDSLNQVFARTIITSFTTLLVLISLLVVGGED
jgi:protein-export membrane protein SecF